MRLNVIYSLFQKHNLKTFHHYFGDSLKYSNTFCTRHVDVFTKCQ